MGDIVKTNGREVVSSKAFDPLSPTITIDSNERGARYTTLLEGDDLFVIEFRRLDVGDIEIGDLVIERKTEDDFIASMKNGRLFRQLILMKRLYRRRALLIESSMEQRRIYNPMREGGVIRIACSMQIPVLFSGGPEMTSRLIRRTALQVLGFTSPHVHRSLVGNATDSFYQVNVLVGIPGVGLARAKALPSHFGSLSRIFGASSSELQKVDGIGLTLAEEISRIARWSEAVP